MNLLQRFSETRMAERRNAVMHVVNKFKVKSETQAFRCLMVYQDTQTGFCFVRALFFKLDLDIVMELFKIFTLCWPPSELLVYSCSGEMVDKIQMHLKTLCPTMNINFIKKHDASAAISMEVVSKLNKWTLRTNKHEWEIGCCIVQREINTAVPNDSTSLSPHNLVFKGLGKVHDSQKGTQNRDTSTDVTQHQTNLNVSQEQNKLNVSQDQNKTNVSQEQNKTNVTQDQNKTNVTQEQNIAEVHSLGNYSKTLLNNSLNTIQVKDEIVDNGEMNSIKDRTVVFEGGLILPGFKKSGTTPDVEIKMERLDE